MRKRIIVDGLKMLWKPILILAFAEILNIYLNLFMGITLGDFTEHILHYDVPGSLSRSGILLLCILAGTLVSPLIGLMGNYFLFTDALAHDRCMFDRYFRMPYEMQREIPLGEVEYRIENDPNQFRLLLVFMARYLLCVLAALPGLAIVFGKIDPLMALIVVVLSLIKWLVAGRMGKLSARGVRAEREFYTQLRKYEMDISGNRTLFSMLGWRKSAGDRIHRFMEKGLRQLEGTIPGRGVAEATGRMSTALFPLLILLAGCVEMERGKLDLPSVLAVLVIFPSVEKGIDMIDYCVKNRKNMEDILERMAFFYRKGAEETGEGRNTERIEQITVDSLSCGYGEKTVLENCSLVLEHHTTAICGENGRGKSTLLKVICGFLQNYRGEIYVGEKRLKGNEEAWFPCFGYVPQEPFIFEESLEENIAMAETYDEGRMERMISMTGLDRLKGAQISNVTVSGGERQRIALARALYCGRDWIFMDEPGNNLDADTTLWLRDFIAGTDRALVFVTHDQELVRAAESVIRL